MSILLFILKSFVLESFLSGSLRVGFRRDGSERTCKCLSKEADPVTCITLNMKMEVLFPHEIPPLQVSHAYMEIYSCPHRTPCERAEQDSALE